jgi:LysR family hydrogen peroxide-inducible transcriptional activator
MLPARWIVHNYSGTRRARPELHQLAVFLQVVEQRSFSGAARRLGCSQPAVSQTIRRLEDIYGGDLFARRRGVPLALTPIGKAVLPGVRRILDAVDRQMVDATSAARSDGGTLSVGFCPGLFGGRFRTGMAAFAAEAPLVRLRLVEDAPDALRMALDRHRLDMMVSPLPGMTNDAEHVSEFLWHERLVAALPEKGRLACRGENDPPFLRAVRLDLPCVMDDDDQGRASHGAHVGHEDPRHEISPATVLDLVAMGLGTGIVLASAATPRPGVNFQPIDEGDAQIAIHARWLRNDANPIRHRLLRHFRAAAKADRKSIPA